MPAYTIEGSILDVNGKSLPNVSISIHEHLPLDFLDHVLDSTLSGNDGSFKIPFKTWIKPRIYLTINDSKRQFKSVVYNGEPFDKMGGPSESVVWRSSIIDLDNLKNINITVNVIPSRKILDKYDAVVIGSGFGGTISSLTLAKKFKNKNKGERVCILERGQWWVSHEMPDKASGRIANTRPSIREHLDSTNAPYYSTWAYPDNIEGALKLFANARPINRQGLYDYRDLGNVKVIASSGVGGGSLVYSNVTEKPPSSTYENWPTETEGPSLEPYFEMASNFIGVNTITTTAGIGGFLLKRSKAFQEAAQVINQKNESNPANNISIINQKREDGSIDFDAKLSITDISLELFAGTKGALSTKGPLSSDNVRNVQTLDDLRNLVKEDIFPIENKYPNESNVCQRQGRCVLGCIPGARHTLNKQLHNAVLDGLPLDIHPFCEVYDIKEIKDDPEGHKYRIDFYDFSLTDEKELTDAMKINLTRSIVTKIVVISAGSLGSTELLLKCKKLDLNRKVLGSKFTTNGDVLGVVMPTKVTVDASRGPIVTSIAKFSKNGKFALSIEDSGVPKMFADLFAYLFGIMSKNKDGYIPQTDLIELLNREFITDIVNNRKIMDALINRVNVPSLAHSGPLSSLVTNLLNIINSSVTHASSPEERVNNILMLSGMGIDSDPTARLILDEKTDSITLDSKYDLKQSIFTDIIGAMKEFAAQTGKDGEESLIIPFWDSDPNARTQFVLHPLGGCPMGPDASVGIVNHLGQLFRGSAGRDLYDGFYVIDGSIIPTPIGVNPSLTISALAFRIAGERFGKDNLPK